MKRHPLLRSALKWLCTIVTLSAAIAWPVSVRHLARCWCQSRTTLISLEAAHGQLEFWSVESLPASGFDLARTRTRTKATSRPLFFGASVTRYIATDGQHWWFEFFHNPRGLMFSIPLWFPLLTTIYPTIRLWRTDLTGLRGRARSRRGLCPSCAYDRRGLAPDALCPECGSPPLKSPPPNH